MRTLRLLFVFGFVSLAMAGCGGSQEVVIPAEGQPVEPPTPAAPVKMGE